MTPNTGTKFKKTEVVTIPIFRIACWCQKKVNAELTSPVNTSNNIGKGSTIISATRPD